MSGDPASDPAGGGREGGHGSGSGGTDGTVGSGDNAGSSNGSSGRSRRPGAATAPAPLRLLLATVSWPEWRSHPLRNLTALLAVALGVALAFSVQLINESALSEFSAAVRSVDRQADFELRGRYRGVAGGFDEALYGRVALHPQVEVASPVVEVDTFAWRADGSRVALRLLGIDALVAGRLDPALQPQPFDAGARLAPLDPQAAFLNPAARQALGLTSDDGRAALRLQIPPAPTQPGLDGARADAADASVTTGSGSGSAVMSRAGTGTDGAGRAAAVGAVAAIAELRIAGRVAQAGPALAVTDIAGAQTRFGLVGRLSRIDVRLVPGADRARVLRELALPDGVTAVAPEQSAERVSNVSRAYRVNLTVLALVALFTGAFLVYSVLSLAVARRLPQFALLGVLGLTARERLALVVAEAALLGAVGSALGLALGTGLAALALRLLSGDLGGGYFPGVAPTLRFSGWAALAYGALGIAAATAGGWLPARAAERIAPAQALKGLGGVAAARRSGRLAARAGPLLVAAAVALALLPPVGGLPIGAYASVACLLLGGIAGVPAMVGALLAGVAPPRHALALLAVERARRQRETATTAVAGVVAGLALSVALTVMVTSFRGAVAEWLEALLPADLYVRGSGSAGPGSASYDSVFLDPALVAAVARLPGVARVDTQRATSIALDPARAAVALIARPIGAEPAKSLPLVGELRDPLSGPQAPPAVYASEAMAALYGSTPGRRLALPLPGGGTAEVFVRGVWRDYARQQGALLIDSTDWQRLTGDTRVNDLAVRLAPPASGDTEAALLGRVQRDIATLAGTATPVEFSSATEIRRASLAIFDRSFAVTYWLQAVAIGIGLVGVAASFSAQVLARGKELGLLAHLGLTRRQIVAVVAAEGAVWTAVGTLLGLALGIAVSVVLVHVVNPQSFHWTMELRLPWPRLALLCGAVLAAGSVTAWLAARTTTGRNPAAAVKQDW